MTGPTPYYARAIAIMRSPKMLLALITSAMELYRREGSMSSAFDSVRSDLATALRLVHAWMDGRYTAVSTRSITVLIGAIVYFVTPTDAVPDILPAVGMVDDVAVLGLVTAQLRSELNAFRASESPA